MTSEFKKKLGIADAGNVAASTAQQPAIMTSAPALGNPQQVIGQPQVTGQSNGTQMPAPATSAPQPVDAGTLLASLANFGKPAATPVVSAPPSVSAPASFPHFPGFPNGVAPPPQFAGFPPPPPLIQPQQPVSNGQATAQPATPLPQAANTQAHMVNMLQNFPGGPQAMMQFFQQIPQEQLPQVLAAMGMAPPPPPPIVSAPSMAMAASTSVPAPAQNGHAADERDYRLREEGANNQHNRDRSQSPDRKRQRMTPPKRRESPTYGAYDPSAAQQNEGGSQGQQQDRKSRRNQRWRDRKQRNSPQVQQQQGQSQQLPFLPNVPAIPANRVVEYDGNLPDGNIKVLSRTLFIGGANATESELRHIFTRFGNVQTVIVSNEKRHAFVKMCNREDAVRARVGMEKLQEQGDVSVTTKARQTKWGVGFGPRECSDYSTGISVIPIEKLTDADRKWVVNSEYGGTGGLELTTGLVIEEPDIEIGAGVSSKAMSKRVGPDAQNKPNKFEKFNQGHQNHQNQHNNHGHGRGGHGKNHHGGGGFDPNAPRFRKPEPKLESPKLEPNNVGVPPAVPGFGFQLPGMMNFG